MGYNTDYNGKFEISPVVKVGDFNDINDFVEKRFDSVHPSFYCDWRIQEDWRNNKSYLVHNGSEKSYNQAEWLKLLIETYFRPRGYTLNGEITWEGDDSYDLGKIVVTDNEVKILKAKIIYEEV